MDRKEAFDIVLSRVDESKREEVVERLREVATRAEKLAILAEYGIEIKTPEDILGEGWDGQAVELSDADLKDVAGGSDFNWHAECNCE